MPLIFNVNILSGEGTIFAGSVRSMTAPGELGYFGILPNHAPFMTTLTPGTIRLTDESGKIITFESKSGGFFRVLRNKADILLEHGSTNETC